MNKVYGIGETVLDIIFVKDQPVAAVPGGSVYNGMITLGRLGVNGAFISELGDDRAGDYVVDFLRRNGIESGFLSRRAGTKTAVSLAYLDEHNDAQYSFYKDYINAHIDFDMPPVKSGDVALFGSYYVLNPILRGQVLRFLTHARSHGAVLYYDINFRANHQAEKDGLMKTICENYDMADIVRGSADDFNVLYGTDDPDYVYSLVCDHCGVFICTRASYGVDLYTPMGHRHYDSQKIEPVSTVGAGDNFNAGIVYALLKKGVGCDGVISIPLEEWDSIVACAIDMSTQACLSISNYVSREFASTYKIG